MSVIRLEDIVDSDRGFNKVHYICSLVTH